MLTPLRATPSPRQVTPTNRWDWAGLRAKIAKHGVRNSLLVAPMPTASTSQILGFNEWFVARARTMTYWQALSDTYAGEKCADGA